MVAEKDAGADTAASAPLGSAANAGSALWTVHGSVRGVRRLTPSMLEVTVAGLDDYPLAGGDEFVYVLVSPDGIPREYAMGDFMEQRADDPVRGAYYTVRRSRPSVGEVDLWVVAHDHAGSVAEWMRHARTGDPVALWGPRRGFEIPTDVAEVLLVADETGLAAVAALVETADPDVRLVAVLESAGGDDRPPMPTHRNLRTVWVDREGAPGTRNRLLDAVRAELTRSGITPSMAFGAAESRHVSAIRHHLRFEVAMAADAVSMTGYWRRSD